MKAKPLFIIFGVLILITFAFLFFRGRLLSKPVKNEVYVFLQGFGKSLAAGNIDSLKNDFETDQHQKALGRLLNIFSGKTSSDGKSKPVFKIDLDIDHAQVIIQNAELAQATIPVDFKHDSIAPERTVLVLKIRKSGGHRYKIVQIDARRMLTDMIAFEKKVKMIGLSDKDLFSPITLAAFKTAAQLKSRYDSVLYFQYIDGKTYYFVAKGKYLQYSYDDSTRKANVSKIGLLGPNLKEIIPVKYDRIHNINGTIDGLIEVENDSKKGLFDLAGNIIVPVEYEEVYPLVDGNNFALLQKGDDYFYLKKDLKISDKVEGLKIGEQISKIKNFNNSFSFEDKGSDNLMEYNSREMYTSLIISPSYMVDLGILPQFIDLPNHLRKPIVVGEEDDEGEGSEYYKVTFDGHQNNDNNWFETAYYSILDNYLGGRSGLYQSKNMLVIDKKSNKIITYSANAYVPERDGGGALSGTCNDNALRQLNDTLFELKSTAIAGVSLNGIQLDEFPHYTYLHLVRGKLEPLLTQRYFGFTQFVKMDDSYLDGCYLVNSKAADHMPTELLQYMKNEIFASYGLKFKTDKWAKEFQYKFGYDEKDLKENVNDSLTVIDKYNINWITQKLKGAPSTTLAATR